MDKKLEGMETEVSDTSFDDGNIAKKYQTSAEADYWNEELQAEEKEHRNFREKGRKIIQRYADERTDGDNTKSFYNVLASNTEIKQSALYARTPVPEISRRFCDASDDVSRVASMVLQRCISIELENEDFDSKFKQMALDRLLPGFAIGWLRLDDDNGVQTSFIDYVNFDDFFWSPSKTWQQCRWVARRVPMNKEAVKARFGDTSEELNNLSFCKPSLIDTNKNNDLAPRHITEETIDVYEIWDKTRSLVFWITEGAEKPLDVSEDTTNFPDFFPTPLPPLGRFTNSNTVPIPDYQLAQDQYRELNELNNRCSKLVAALKLRWVYDNSRQELKNLYTTTGELQGIGVSDWAVFSSEKGGLKNSVEFAPLDEIAATYQKLIVARETVKQQIFDIEGISDLMRGNSQPYESATQTSAKAAASSTRLGVAQMAAAQYIQRLLRLKAHLIQKFYSPEIIVERAGELSQEDQRYLPQAIELLKNTTISNFRLLVSVDSIQLPNFVQEKTERNEFIQAVTGLIAQVMPAIKQTPELAPFAISLVKFGVAGYRGANELEGVLDAALDQMMSEKQQNEQNKPPSPEELKAQMHREVQQTKMQSEMIKNQTAKEIAALNAQVKSQELQLKAAELQMSAEKMANEEAHWQDETDNDRIDRAHKIAMDLNPIERGVIK